MTQYSPTKRTQVTRLPKRGVYDRSVVHRILDESLLCNVGVVVDGLPRNIPTAILRVGEFVYIHGSTVSQLLRALADGAPACITVSIIDGLVAARSGFNCAVDYRSVVIFAIAEEITDEKEKKHLLDLFIDHMIPGHTVRPPTNKELRATAVLRFPLFEVSAKVRDTGVDDFEEDLVLYRWAGVIPLKTIALTPKSCIHVKPNIAVPDYATRFAGWKSVSLVDDSQ